MGLTNNGTLAVMTDRRLVIYSATVAANSIVVSGTGGTFGTPGATYYVLSSTNLNLPLLQWTRIATNQFNTNGNFNFTNAVAPGIPAAFYRLQLP
jgi:hypothetical protein